MSSRLLSVSVLSVAIIVGVTIGGTAAWATCNDGCAVVECHAKWFYLDLDRVEVFLDHDPARSNVMYSSWYLGGTEGGSVLGKYNMCSQGSFTCYPDEFMWADAPYPTGCGHDIGRWYTSNCDGPS